MFKKKFNLYIYFYKKKANNNTLQGVSGVHGSGRHGGIFPGIQGGIFPGIHGGFFVGVSA